MCSFLGLLLQPFQARLLDLPNLVRDKTQARHAAPQLSQRVRRQERIFWCVQPLKLLWRFAQSRLEASDAEPGQGALHSVHNARALADEALALSVRSLGIFLLERWDRRHAAVIPFTTQPAEKRPLEQLGIEPVCLRPPMFARDSNARRMNDMGFDATRPQPTSQPEAVTPSFEGDHGPGDHMARLRCLVRPASEQLEQRHFVRLKLLRWMALDTRKDTSDEPARKAHLDDHDQRAILLQGGEGPAQVVRLRHGTLHRLFPATMVPCPRRSPHSIFGLLLRWLAELLRACIM